MLENQGNGLAKVRQTFLARLALPIGARHFSAVGDIPWAVSLDDRREFVARFFVLPLPAPGFASAEKAQHVGDEENQQYGPQPYAGASTVTPAAMAVVPPPQPSTSNKTISRINIVHLSYLLLQHLFNLPDLLLNLAGELFGLSFSLQVGIAGDLAGRLFGFAFHFMKLALNLILRAWAHLSFPYRLPWSRFGSKSACMLTQAGKPRRPHAGVIPAVRKAKTAIQSANFADICIATLCFLGVFANGHSRATEHWIGSHFEYWKERTTIMVMKRLIGFVFAGALAFSALAAEIVVKVAPPKIVVEKRSARPSPRHVWVQGYHNWDGQKYVWTAGRWDVPPQGHSKWVAHRWVHKNGGYVLVEGHWQ